MTSSPPANPWPIPSFRIEINAPGHEGAALLQSMDLNHILYTATLASFEWLYARANLKVPRKCAAVGY
jgi:hypothetical protein